MSHYYWIISEILYNEWLARELEQREAYGQYE